MPTRVDKTISSDVLVYYFDKYADEYCDDYPVVKNPAALMDGIESVIKAIGEGQINDNTLLYIIEDEEDLANPFGSQYVLAITRGRSGQSSRNFQIRLFYTKTNELESISTFEEDKVVWSPDNLENSAHPMRTKFYLGFIYLIGERAPGFDREPVPEHELTAAELIALGVEGELPAELIEIELPEGVPSEVQHEEPEQIEVAPFEEEPAQIQSVPEQDDTDVIVETPETIEEEYDDLETDYEELFA